MRLCSLPSSLVRPVTVARGAAPGKTLGTALGTALGVAVAGCGVKAVDSGGLDSAGAGALACDPLAVTMVEEWTEDDLPKVADKSHTPAGVALGDLDGDGWLDAFLAYGGGAAAFRNDGTGRLSLEPEWTITGYNLPDASAVALVDLEGDGDLDVFLGREKEELDLLLRNDGQGHFSPEPLANSEAAASTGSFADLDGDGDLDLFIGVTTTDTEGAEVLEGNLAGDGCKMYLQDDAGAFVDATDRLPQDVINGWTFQGSPIDHDGDGDLDIYLANDFGAWLTPNKLLVNDGDANFSVAEDCFCELVMFGMGAAVGDANEDALPDLYITDMGGPNLLVNMGDGTFYDGTVALGAAIPETPTNLTSWGTSFVDLDRDSWMDLVVTFGQLGQPELTPLLQGDEEWEDGEEQHDVILLGDREGKFYRADTEFADPSRTRAVAVGDLDRDGRPDLVTAGKYFMRQWHVGGGCERGLQVELWDNPKNAHGIGARVQVEVGARVVTQWMLPSTTGSSNAPELYFGLGDAAEAARVTVTWPDGTTSEEANVAAGTALRFEKP